jgi:hypothetical protein
MLNQDTRLMFLVASRHHVLVHRATVERYSPKYGSPIIPFSQLELLMSFDPTKLHSSDAERGFLPSMKV